MNPATRIALQGRIDQLESLVRSLLDKQPKRLSTPLHEGARVSTSTAVSAEEPILNDFGHMDLKDQESSYF